MTWARSHSIRKRKQYGLLNQRIPALLVPVTLGKAFKIFQACHLVLVSEDCGVD